MLVSKQMGMFLYGSHLIFQLYALERQEHLFLDLVALGPGSTTSQGPHSKP